MAAISQLGPAGTIDRRACAGRVAAAEGLTAAMAG